MAVAELYVNEGKKWLGTESDIDARRACHVLVSDHYMEAHIACKEVRPRPAA